MSRVALNDPGNAHGIVYTWGTFGIGINRSLVSKAMPNIPVGSWRLIFDPALASKVARCGINLMDDPVGVVRVALIFLGRNPNEPTLQDLADVEQMLAKIRPSFAISTLEPDSGTRQWDLCIALAYNGNVVQASKRAKEAKDGIDIDYLIPEEGTLLWFDLNGRSKGRSARGERLPVSQLPDGPSCHREHIQDHRICQCEQAATPLLDTSISTDPAIYSEGGPGAAPGHTGGTLPELARGHYASLAEVQDGAIEGGVIYPLFAMVRRPGFRRAIVTSGSMAVKPNQSKDPPPPPRRDVVAVWRLPSWDSGFIVHAPEIDCRDHRRNVGRMTMSNIRFSMVGTFFLLLSAVTGHAQTYTKPYVRAITAFIRLDPATLNPQIVGALTVLRAAQAELLTWI